MRGRLRGIAAAALVAIALLALPGTGHTKGTTAIGPGQHFSGIVNGMRKNPVVHTVCPGPAVQGQTGPVAGGQTLSVVGAARGKGYTGFFSQIYAWFAQDSSGSTPQQVTFTTYGTPQGMPSAARVPCSGSGQVVFSSCPYLAPCAAGWIPDTVQVTFENIAV